MTILQRVWVLANLYEDDKRQHDYEQHKFEMVLQFINSDAFRQYKAMTSGKGPTLPREAAGEVDVEPASPEFLRMVEELPRRRVRNPAVRDEYIPKRLKELASTIERKNFSGVAVDKTVSESHSDMTLIRRVIPKRKQPYA